MTNLLTQPQVEQLAIQAGFSRTPYGVLDDLPPYRVIAAIAMCEGQTEASRARTMATHVNYTDADAIGDQALANTVWGWSYGLTQVRSLRSHKGTNDHRDELRLPEPLFNLEAAYEIWVAARRRPNPPLINGKRNWTGMEPWSTWSSRMFEAYLQDAYPVPPTAYKVISGDSLAAIAIKLGMGDWSTWQEVNALANPNLIFVGQTLVRPWWPYVARPGDTWAALAAANHLKTADLRAFNRAPSGQPSPGQTVLVKHRLLTRRTP